LNVGAEHSLILIKDGSVWGIGSNAEGQLGPPKGTGRLDPAEVGIINDGTAIAAGGAHSLAVRDGGEIWGWGAGSSGQLGNGTLEGHDFPRHVATNLFGIRSLAAGSYYSLAIVGDGTLWAWGRASLGADTLLGPEQVNELQDVGAIAVGDSHALAVAAGCGTVWAWGSNIRGQLGNGTDTDHSRPVQVVGLGELAGAAGCDRTLTVLQTGEGRIVTTPAGIDGEDCRGTCTEIFPAGTLVSLTAVEIAGWRFDGWDGYCTGTDPMTSVHLDVSRICRATFKEIPVPAAPQDVSASAGDGQVTVSWDSVADATSYNLYWKETGGVTTADNPITDVTSPYVHIDRTNNTTYYYIVTAVNATAEGPPSSEVSATPMAVGVIFTLEVQAYGISGASGNVTSSPAGIDCDTPNTCTQDFVNGTLVRLTAVPVAPSVFDSWGGPDTCDTTGVDRSGNNYCEIKVFQDMSIIAIFGPPGPK
jgi:hypothetical protein